MHPLLQQIYGTGHQKVASGEDKLDLDQLSAAELLAGLEDGSIDLGDVGGEPDLSELSARDLLEIWAAEEEGQSEKTAAATLQSMAQDGSFDYFDTAGRIVAHSMYDEMNKIASDDDDLILDLDQLSAQDLLALIEEGYEIEGLTEKTAGWKDGAGKAGNWLKDKAMAAGRGIHSAVTGGEGGAAARTAIKARRAARKAGDSGLEPSRWEKAKQYGRGYGAQVATGAAGATAVGGGALALRARARRRKAQMGQ